jgi:F-type H+-transporting ATPase subunit c
MNNPEVVKMIVPSATIVLGAIVPAAAIGFMASKGLEAIGRNPEAADKVQATLILTVAFVEAIAVYALVVALIAKFVA